MLNRQRRIGRDDVLAGQAVQPIPADAVQSGGVRPDLDPEAADRVEAAVDVLSKYGPTLGRPPVDRLPARRSGI